MKQEEVSIPEAPLTDTTVSRRKVRRDHQMLCGDDASQLGRPLPLLLSPRRINIGLQLLCAENETPARENLPHERACWLLQLLN